MNEDVSLNIKKAAELIGIGTVIQEIGIKRIIQEIGIDSFLDEIGEEAITEWLNRKEREKESKETTL